MDRLTVHITEQTTDDYRSIALTGHITQEIKGHLRPVTQRALTSEGREEGDCNLIPASP